MNSQGPSWMAIFDYSWGIYSLKHTICCILSIFSLKHTVFASYQPFFHNFTQVANKSFDSFLLEKAGTCHKLTPRSSWQPLLNQKFQIQSRSRTKFQHFLQSTQMLKMYIYSQTKNQHILQLLYLLLPTLILVSAYDKYLSFSRVTSPNQLPKQQQQQ